MSSKYPLDIRAMTDLDRLQSLQSTVQGVAKSIP